MWFLRKDKHLLETIQKLQEQVSHLQEQVNEKEKASEYHFHIQQVDIKEPTLEKLTFQLDTIDIEEVSGALNVGNNLGVSVGEADNKKLTSKYTQKVNRTEDGYSISFKDKEGQQ